MGACSLVILAAGRGQRFGGCKQLAPVGPNGQTLIEHAIADARRAGFERVVIVTRPELDISHLPSVEIVHQSPSVFGTVPAVLAARRAVGDEPFGVINADDLYPPSAFAALASWAGPGHAVIGFALAATMGPNGRPVNRGLCETGAGGRVVRLAEASITERGGGFFAREVGSSREQPVAEEQLVSMNAWALAPTIWPQLAAAVAARSDEPREILLPVVMGELLGAGAVDVTCLPVTGACRGITWPEDLEMMRSLVAVLRPVQR